MGCIMSHFHFHFHFHFFLLFSFLHSDKRIYGIRWRFLIHDLKTKKYLLMGDG